MKLAKPLLRIRYLSAVSVLCYQHVEIWQLRTKPANTKQIRKNTPLSMNSCYVQIQ